MTGDLGGGDGPRLAVVHAVGVVDEMTGRAAPSDRAFGAVLRGGVVPVVPAGYGVESHAPHVVAGGPA